MEFKRYREEIGEGGWGGREGEVYGREDKAQKKLKHRHFQWKLAVRSICSYYMLLW